MAHFAEIKIDNNEVIRVVVINDQDIFQFGENSVEAENWVKNNIPKDGYLNETIFGGNYPQTYWKRTSYNTINNTHRSGGDPFRGNYAGPGSTYDLTLNVFWPPKPYDSWVKNNTIIDWEAPVSFPSFKQIFDNTEFEIIPRWEEANLRWLGKTVEETPRNVVWNLQNSSWTLL